MVECHLAKVDVEGSNPFSRSKKTGRRSGRFFMSSVRVGERRLAPSRVRARFASAPERYLDGIAFTQHSEEVGGCAGRDG